MHNPISLEAARNTLLSGGVVAFPTETFYGLGVNPESSIAVDNLLKLKDRRAGEGVPLIIDSAARVQEICVLPQDLDLIRFRKFIELFWPGALTLVLPRKKSANIDLRLCGPDETIALRHSSSAIATALATAIGGVITATSANPHGLTATAEREKVQEYFPDGILIVDRTESANFSLPSTIIKLLPDRVELLRDGAIPFSTVLEEWKKLGS